MAEYVKMAVQNILANKGRSFLTMLGIIIGIASVIAIVSIGEGTRNQMNSEIDGVGSGQIYIYCSECHERRAPISHRRIWRLSGIWKGWKALPSVWGYQARL